MFLSVLITEDLNLGCSNNDSRGQDGASKVNSINYRGSKDVGANRAVVRIVVRKSGCRS